VDFTTPTSKVFSTSPPDTIPSAARKMNKYQAKQDMSLKRLQYLLSGVFRPLDVLGLEISQNINNENIQRYLHMLKDCRALLFNVPVQINDMRNNIAFKLSILSSLLLQQLTILILRCHQQTSKQLWFNKLILLKLSKLLEAFEIRSVTLIKPKPSKLSSFFDQVHPLSRAIIPATTTNPGQTTIPFATTSNTLFVVNRWGAVSPSNILNGLLFSSTTGVSKQFITDSKFHSPCCEEW
jgi:hypothetical protein